MAAPATVTVTLSPQEKVFAPVAAAGGDAAAASAAPVAPSGSSHHPAAVEAAAAEVEMLEARRTVETAAGAGAAATIAASTALDASAAAAAPTVLDAPIAAPASAAAAVSAALDAQASSEAVNSTLMGIALLAYLQGSAAKHEASGAAGGGGYASTAAPSSSQGGPDAAAARPGARPHERLPHRRYQRMSPADVDALAEPLTRTLAAIKASQSKAEYTCKRLLSSPTYLHRVHVNAAMSTNLLPDYGGGHSRSPPRDNENAARRARPTGGAPTCRKPNTVLFRRRVRVLDERDREWLITYESLCSAGQRHTRFSAGWAALCKANEFKVGETIVFSRWGKRDGGVVVVERERGGCAGGGGAV